MIIIVIILRKLILIISLTVTQILTIYDGLKTLRRRHFTPLHECLQAVDDPFSPSMPLFPSQLSSEWRRRLYNNLSNGVVDFTIIYLMASSTLQTNLSIYLDK